MECSRGERLSITLAKNRINRAPERAGKARVEVDIFELLRDSEYETAETSEYHPRQPWHLPAGAWHPDIGIFVEGKKKNLLSAPCAEQFSFEVKRNGLRGSLLPLSFATTWDK